MGTIDELFLSTFEDSTLPTPEFNADSLERGIRITDRRVAQLLIVLHEIDESSKGLQNVSEAQLSEIVGQAILACGFTDLAEARCVMTPILEAMEVPHPLGQEYS